MAHLKLKSRVKVNLPALFTALKNIHSFIKRPRLWIHEKILKDGIFVYENELYMASLFPKKLLDETIDLFHPDSVLDMGCGTGKSLDYFLSKGIDARGVEGSRLAISRADHPELITRHNMNKELNLGRKFDLIWSFEVVEHVHIKYVNNLMKTFSNHADRVVMSAAPHGREGDRHFNKQPGSYWIVQFQKYGYGYDENTTNRLREIDEMFSKDMLVFAR